MSTDNPHRDMIVTYRTSHGRQRPDLSYREALTFYRLRHGLGAPPPDPPASPTREPLEARIESGAWLVECPGCHDAFMVDDQDLLFNCVGCGSMGGWHPVVMPAERAEIEAVLLLRPGFRHNAPNRNWIPGETVEDLKRENLEHGIGE